MGSVGLLPCTSSSSCSWSAAGPSEFPFLFLIKVCLWLWSVIPQHCPGQERLASHSQPQNGFPVGLGHSFLFSKILIKVIRPNCAHSFYLVAILSSLCSHGDNSWTVQLLRCFGTGHYLRYQKVSCWELYFNTQQHHLLCSLLGQGLHSQWADTSDRTDRWSGPAGSFRCLLKCLRPCVGRYLLWWRNTLVFLIAVFLWFQSTA